MPQNPLVQAAREYARQHPEEGNDDEQEDESLAEVVARNAAAKLAATEQRRRSPRRAAAHPQGALTQYIAGSIRSNAAADAEPFDHKLEEQRQIVARERMKEEQDA